MTLKSMVLGGVLGLILWSPGWTDSPRADINGGSVHCTAGNYSAWMIVGSVYGASSTAGYTNWITHIGVEEANFKYFLSAGAPNPPLLAPGSTAGSQLVTNSDQSQQLAWTDATNTTPVQYKVYFGTDPHSLNLVTTQATRIYPVTQLNYARTYYWKVNAFDQFGRNTDSAIFTFSIAPSLTHMYCAPNPFRAGRQVTTFIFNGVPGSASMNIYAMPHGELVYSTSINITTQGPGTWVYDGKDGNGQTLYNGVYMAVLDLVGSGKQKFKFMVVK